MERERKYILFPVEQIARPLVSYNLGIQNQPGAVTSACSMNKEVPRISPNLTI